MNDFCDGATCVMIISRRPAFAFSHKQIYISTKKIESRSKNKIKALIFNVVGKETRLLQLQRSLGLNCQESRSVPPWWEARLYAQGAQVIEELGQAMCIYRAVSHTDRSVCAPPCVRYKSCEWQNDDNSHLLKVWVSYSPLYPEIPRTGWQVNSDCNVPLSIHVSCVVMRVCLEAV